MKKAKIIRRIIAAAVLVLLIASFSLVIYIKNNTASVVNRIIEYKQGEDSPWKFSFEDIETTFDDGTTFSGFSLFYDDMFLGRLDSVTVDKGVMGLWKFWKTDGSAITARVKGGRINLTNALASYADYKEKPHSGEFSFYDFITDRTSFVTGENITIEYDYLTGTADSLSLSYTSAGDVLTGVFTSKSIGVIYTDYKGNLINASCSFIKDEDIKITAGADKLHLSGSDAKAEFEGLLFSETTPSVAAFLSGDFLGKLEIGKGEVETKQGTVSFSDGDFLYSDTTLTGSFGDTRVNVLDVSAVTDTFCVTFDAESSFTASFDEMTVNNGPLIYTAGKTEAEGKLTDGAASLKTESIRWDMSEFTDGRIGNAVFTSVSSDVSFSDDFIVDYSAESFTADIPELESTITGNDITAAVDEKKITLSIGSITTDISSLTDGRIGEIGFKIGRAHV